MRWGSVTPYSEINSARKRALSMGRPHGCRAIFDEHPLAAPIDNYTIIMDGELIISHTNPIRAPAYVETDKCRTHGDLSRSANETCDYKEVLWCLWKMALATNAFCDHHKANDDLAAEYWLERYLWRVDKEFDLTRLS